MTIIKGLELPEKKNQHYLAQSYLKGFTIDGEESLIWQYDKRYGRLSNRKSSIGRICSKNYYYEDYSLPNYPSDKKKFEDAIGEVEKVGIDIINSIPKENSSQKISLNSEQKEGLSFYIALQLVRGPNFRGATKSILKYVVEKTAKDLYEAGQLPDPPEVLKKYFDKNGFALEAEIFPHADLQALIQLANYGSIELLNKQWSFTYTPDNKYFVTSDNPVHFYSNDGMGGPFNRNCHILFPLRQDLALICNPPKGLDQESFFKYDGMIVESKEEQIDMINSIIIDAAYRNVYAPIRCTKILENVTKAKGKSQTAKAEQFGDGLLLYWTS